MYKSLLKLTFVIDLDNIIYIYADIPIIGKCATKIYISKVLPIN